MIQSLGGMFRNSNIPTEIIKSVIQDGDKTILVEKYVLYDKEGNEVVIRQNRIDIISEIEKVEANIATLTEKKVELEALLPTT
jgi:hypothetical protein